MLRIASVVMALALAGTAFASPTLTGEFNATVNSAPDQEVCFSQPTGTCDPARTSPSSIVSQFGTDICGTYNPPIPGPPNNKTADEFMCDGPAIGFRWWGLYFGAGWDPLLCPAVGCAGPTFNFRFYIGGTTCPEEALLFAEVLSEPVATCSDLGSNAYEYTAAPAVPGGLPPDLAIYLSIQINENAYPQWGWTESDLNLVGSPSCLIAPGFGINTWTPIAAAAGVGAWCGQSFEVFKEVATPVETSTWGTIKGTYNN